MAINIPGVPFKLTAQDMGGFDFADALKKGFELGATPSKLAQEYLQRELANRMNAAKAKYAEPNEAARSQMLGVQARYAEPTAQEGLKYKQALIEKALRPPAPQYSLIEKAIAGAERIKNLYGENSNEYKAAQDYVTKIGQGSQGISISSDPETGQQRIQIGGLSGKGGGGTFVNPATGEITSAPTSATTANLQKRIVGAEQVEPILKEIIENVPEFQSGWARLASNVAGGLNNWLGTDIDLPSQRQQGKAALSKFAESALGMYGLNATSKNLQEAKNILTPASGESADGYRRRVMKEWKSFLNSKGISQKQLAKGIALNKQAEESPYNVRPGGAQGESVIMYKNGKPHFIPVKDAEDAKTNWGYSYER